MWYVFDCYTLQGYCFATRSKSLARFVALSLNSIRRVPGSRFYDYGTYDDTQRTTEYRGMDHD
jgi:hypothetical protein